jgi:hypothetical protein
VAPAIALAAAPPGGLRGVVRRVVAAVAGFGVLGALHVAIFHFYVRFYPEGSVHPRATLVAPGELAAKLWWYLGEALPNALRVFVLDPLPLPALAIAAVAAVGLTLRWRRGGDPALLGLAASAALLPLAYAANLVTAANWAALRTVGASAAIVWTLAAAGALEFGGRFGERGRRVVLALLAAAVVAQAAQIRWRVAPLVAGLALDEASFVRERLRGLRRRDGIVVFRYPHWGDPGSSLVRYEEIGLPTSDAPWVAGPMLRQLYFELYGRSLLARIEVIAPEQRLPRRGLVVDMHGYLLRRRRQIAKSRGASPGESGAR